MKKLILIIAVLTFIGCQKTTEPEPVPDKPKYTLKVKATRTTSTLRLEYAKNGKVEYYTTEFEDEIFGDNTKIDIKFTTSQIMHQFWFSWQVYNSSGQAIKGGSTQELHIVLE